MLDNMFPEQQFAESELLNAFAAVTISLTHMPPAWQRGACRDLERDDVVGRVARQRGIEVGETADAHALDGVRRNAVGRLALGQPALHRALVAEHQQDVLLAGDFAQPLAERVALAQNVGVIVEEHHADHLDAVTAIFELRQNHLTELITGGVAAGAEDIRNLHEMLLCCVETTGAPSRGGVGAPCKSVADSMAGMATER